LCWAVSRNKQFKIKMASKIFQKKGQRKELKKVNELIESDACVGALSIAVTTKDEKSGQLTIDVFSGGDRRIVLQAITTVINKIVADICLMTGLQVLEDEAKTETGGEDGSKSKA